MTAWNKNVGEIIAELKMLETSFKGFFWLVEGPSDIRFFINRIQSNIELVVAGGKSNVINTIQNLQQDNLNKKLLGIVDADIDWLTPYSNLPSNIISTDPRDIEGILLRSNALEKTLAELANPKKVIAFEEKNKITIREHIRQISAFFGKIRAANSLNRNIKLRKLKPQIFILDNWQYDFDKALDFCVRLGTHDSVEDLKTDISKLPKVDDWNYTRGHDAINILTGGLLKEFGNSSNISEATIESILRAGIEENEYRSSKLSTLIDEWHKTISEAS